MSQGRSTRRQGPTRDGEREKEGGERERERELLVSKDRSDFSFIQTGWRRQPGRPVHPGRAAGGEAGKAGKATAPGLSPLRRQHPLSPPGQPGPPGTAAAAARTLGDPESDCGAGLVRQNASCPKHGDPVTVCPRPTYSDRDSDSDPSQAECQPDGDYGVVEGCVVTVAALRSGLAVGATMTAVLVLVGRRSQRPSPRPSHWHPSHGRSLSGIWNLGSCYIALTGAI